MSCGKKTDLMKNIYPRFNFLFRDQWFLNHGAKDGSDMNVKERNYFEII